MKTVLITGASSGIGYATALSFAKAGFQVVATMRNLEKSVKLKSQAEKENLMIDMMTLDVCNDYSIQTTVNNILNKYQHIDFLINNAGAGFLGSLEQTKLKQVRKVMEVNFFGVWALTQAILPSMRQNRSGQIITVTSVGGVIGQPFNDAYCAAKFAVEGMMESLAPVAKRFGIKISVVEPGPVQSEFVSSMLTSNPDLHHELGNDYKLLLDAYTNVAQSSHNQLAQTAEEVANVILNVAQAAQPDFRYQTSELSKNIVSNKFTDLTGNKIISLTGSVLPELN